MLRQFNFGDELDRNLSDLMRLPQLQSGNGKSNVVFFWEPN